MGLLSGPLSITRFRIVQQIDEPDFDAALFQEIMPGSEVRESSGFVAMEPDAPWQVGAKRWAFRVRIDKLRPDSTAVAERLKQLIREELDTTGAAFVGPKKRKSLRELAEDELLMRAVPSSKILEGCIDGDVLYVASTAKASLGLVMQLLRRARVMVEPKSPWIDRNEPETESEIVPIREPGESVRGCHFLKALVGDREVMVEPETGLVRLMMPETRVTLSGAVLSDLHRYLQRDDVELISAKLVSSVANFRFEASSFRLASIRMETGRHDHWTELLDERLEKIAELFQTLDEKYAELMG